MLITSVTYLNVLKVSCATLNILCASYSNLGPDISYAAIILYREARFMRTHFLLRSSIYRNIFHLFSAFLFLVSVLFLLIKALFMSKPVTRKSL